LANFRIGPEYQIAIFGSIKILTLKYIKGWQVFTLIALIIIADQAIKLYIKTHYFLGEEHLMLGQSWMRLHFVENPGMAWGWIFGGEWGKLVLTLFRLVAVVWGTFLIKSFIQKRMHAGFIICAGLIYAGALGNLLDSMFYGLIFDKGMIYNAALKDYDLYGGVAVLGNKGYTSFLYGNVVDMFYFPLIKTTLPSWVPIWGGERFEFFRPVFNLADAAISVGVIAILLWQKRFFKQRTTEEKRPVTDTGIVSEPIIKD
jgi:signal peptidase II